MKNVENAFLTIFEGLKNGLLTLFKKFCIFRVIRIQINIPAKFAPLLIRSLIYFKASPGCQTSDTLESQTVKSFWFLGIWDIAYSELLVHIAHASTATEVCGFML